MKRIIFQQQKFQLCITHREKIWRKSSPADININSCICIRILTPITCILNAAIALKSLVQNVHRGMRCHPIGTTHVIGIHIIHFRPQEVAYHRSVALVVDDYGNARFILKKVWTDDSARQKSAPNSDFLGMHLELVYLAWIGIIPNSTILFVHISKNGPHH